MNDSRLTEDEAYEAACLITDYDWGPEYEIALKLVSRWRVAGTRVAIYNDKFQCRVEETKE